jgi:hypothetical protein
MFVDDANDADTKFRCDISRKVIAACVFFRESMGPDWDISDACPIFWGRITALTRLADQPLDKILKHLPQLPDAHGVTRAGDA